MFTYLFIYSNFEKKFLFLVGRGHTIPPSSWLVIPEDRYSKVILARDKELFWLKQSEQQAIPIVNKFLHKLIIL